MAEKTYSITEIREAITRLPEQFNEDVEAVTVTRHGKPVMKIVPEETFNGLHKTVDELQETVDELRETIEALLETLEIVQDQELMEAFRQGVKDMEEGRLTPMDEAFKELGWE